MMENLEHCPICGNDQFSKYIECVDHAITKETFTIKKCNACSFLFTSPRPGIHSIDKYYDSNDYISHSDESTSIINKVYKIARKYTLQNKLNIVNKYAAEKTLLDYGCGTGHFLETCRNKNWSVVGIEPNHTAREKARTNGLDIKENLSELKANKFEIISLWHVLEHIHDLNFTFNQLVKHLQDKGKMIIAVPNHQSKDATYYNKQWAAYDVPRHLYHFNQQTMAKFLNKHKLTLLNIIPMKLDAFYVSMLSEQYKGNRYNLFKPFINACISNVYANLNNKNYSSLIYIAQK